MADTYSGMGYPGSIDTLGNTQEGIFKIQDYLNYKGSSIDVGLGNILSQEAQRITGLYDLGYFSSFLNDMGTPQTLEDLIVDYRVYLYATFPGTPVTGLSGTIQDKMNQARAWLNDPLNLHQSELDYTSGTALSVLVSLFVQSTGIYNENWEVNAGLNPPNKLSVLFTNEPAAANAFVEDLIKRSYGDFVDKFVFQPTPDTMTQFFTGFQTYLQDFVKGYASGINATTQITYENFFKAYFGNGDFDQFFANFVSKSLTEEGIFTPTLLFDKWTQEVLNNYALIIPSSSATAPSSVDAGGRKTLVLNRIFKLLVLMIESLQKVAAAQSDRLNLFSKWQKAYTDLQNGIKYFLKDGQDIHANILSDDDKRNNLNSYNASLIETIKARKSVLGDDAKNLQTQINQSNDTVNQQTSIATSILQELATILSSLYR